MSFERSNFIGRCRAQGNCALTLEAVFRASCRGLSCSGSWRVPCCRSGNGLPLPPWNDSRSQEFETIWRHAGNLNQHHPVDVIRTIDGDTFEARVHLAPGQDVTTRVRLRGIDAPELKAACPEELRMAEAASSALRDLLGQGEVAIYHIGPDKYSGPRRRRRCDQTHRQCFGGADHRRLCAQLQWRPPQWLVRERCAVKKKEPRISAALCLETVFAEISASPPRSCRPTRADRDR